MTGRPVLLDPVPTDWHCPACGRTDRTRERLPHTRYHACVALGGMLAPLLEAGVRAKTVAVERDDYIGTDQVQLNDQGRPVMAVVTTRDDGAEDRLVFAPCATAATD